MRHIVAACSLLLIALAPLSASAEDADQETYGRSAAVGVNFPGVNFKLPLSSKFAAELRGQYEYKILTTTARLYYYPSIPGFGNPKLRPFISAEGGYVSFQGNYSQGNGAIFGGAGGVEYFLSKRFSVQTDFGPYYVMVNDRNTAIEQTGLEFVMNFGINFYFK